MDLKKTFSAVQYASRKLLALNDEKINQILLAVADAAEERTEFIPVSYTHLTLPTILRV